MSRHHAELRLDESGAAWITDRASTNGTFRNGHRLSPREPVLIHDGDRLRLGTRVVLKYACPDPEEEAFQRSMFERTVRDTLTGLFNRAYFLDQLRVLSARDRSAEAWDWRSQCSTSTTSSRSTTRSATRPATRSSAQVAARDPAIDPVPRTSSRRFGGEEFAIALPIGSAESGDGTSRAHPHESPLPEDVAACPPILAGDGQPRAGVRLAATPAARRRPDHLRGSRPLSREERRAEPRRPFHGRPVRHAHDGGRRRPMIAKWPENGFGMTNGRSAGRPAIVKAG